MLSKVSFRPTSSPLPLLSLSSPSPVPLRSPPLPGWNKIGATVLEDLAGGLQYAAALTDLDVSYNALGVLGTASEGGGEHENVTLFAETVASHPSLRHVSLSANHFSNRACAIIAAAIEPNSTIIGLHFRECVGSTSWTTDARGFIVRHEENEDSRAGGRLGSMQSADGSSSCWICGGWSPQYLSLDIDIDDDLQDERRQHVQSQWQETIEKAESSKGARETKDEGDAPQPAAPAYFLSIDGYKREHVEPQQDGSASRGVIRMVPPGKPVEWIVSETGESTFQFKASVSPVCVPCVPTVLGLTRVRSLTPLPRSPHISPSCAAAPYQAERERLRANWDGYVYI